MPAASPRDSGGRVVHECPSVSLRSVTNDTDAPQRHTLVPANVTTQGRAMTRGEPAQQRVALIYDNRDPAVEGIVRVSQTKKHQRRRHTTALLTDVSNAAWLRRRSLANLSCMGSLCTHRNVCPSTKQKPIGDSQRASGAAATRRVLEDLFTSPTAQRPNWPPAWRKRSKRFRLRLGLPPGIVLSAKTGAMHRREGCYGPARMSWCSTRRLRSKRAEAASGLTRRSSFFTNGRARIR
jgi:hypothetical protein